MECTLCDQVLILRGKSLLSQMKKAPTIDTNNLSGEEYFPIVDDGKLYTLALGTFAQLIGGGGGGGGGGLPSHSIAEHNNVQGNPQNGDVLTYNNGFWSGQAPSGGTIGWGLSGNSITNSDFIGTTNGKGVAIKINGTSIGFVDEHAVIFGQDSAPNVNNDARPYGSLISLGKEASFKASRYSPQIAIGDSALYNAGIKNATDIIVGGFYAILTVGTTDYTTVGAINNDIGTYFTATGIPTGNGTVHALDASGNIAIGSAALYQLTEAANNIAIGSSAGNTLQDGTHNIMIGAQSGAYLVNGDHNIYLGEYIASSLPESNHAIGIGANIYVPSNTTIIGTYGQTEQTHLEGTLTLGSQTKDSSALLQMNSTSQGFLPPRMTGAQAEAINSPAEGLMVYATDGSGVTITSRGWWGFDGTNWVKLN